MEEITKKGVQYLINAEKSFLSYAEKGGHHLHFCPDYRCLYTRKFTKNGDMLIFNFDFLALEWKSETGLHEFLTIKNREPYEIVNWIETMAIEAGIEQRFDFEGALYSSSSKKDFFTTVSNIDSSKRLTNRSAAIQWEIERAFSDFDTAW